jgi:hypothetical protein
MNDRSESDPKLRPEGGTDSNSEATEIPKRVGIAAGMFFPVFIVLAVAAVIIIFFLVR